MNQSNILTIISILLLTSLSYCQKHSIELSNSEEKVIIKNLYESDWNESDDKLNTCEKKYIKTDPLSPPPIPEDMRKRLEEQHPELLFIDKASPLPESWIIESSLEQAPPLLKGIILYLDAQSDLIRYYNPMFIPSCQRFILVGPPGSGKTTLAHAIASKLECPAILIPASSLLGHFRNETANNISAALEEYTYMQHRVIIIIDELHKLFEHHESDRSDDSQSAAAFWLAIDQMEKHCSQAILICTANDVSTLPAEIKSRFTGKVIKMKAQKKEYAIKVFKESIRHDICTYLDRSINNTFILKTIDQLPTCSLRDIRLLIDTAKMFYYEENPLYEQDHAILLTKDHFKKAINQLQAESSIFAGDLSKKFVKNLEKWGLAIGIVANLSLFSKTLYDFVYSPR